MELACFPSETVGSNHAGRPSKFTFELLEKLAEAVALGMPDKFACERVGITEETFYEWKKNKPEFSEYINHARAEKMAKRIQRIDVGETGWQGTAWILERRWGEHFARPELQINMSVNATVEHTVNMIPEAELHRLLGITREVETETISIDPVPIVGDELWQPALTDTPPQSDIAPAAQPEPTNGSEGV